MDLAAFAYTLAGIVGGIVTATDGVVAAGATVGAVEMRIVATEVVVAVGIMATEGEVTVGIVEAPFQVDRLQKLGGAWESICPGGYRAPSGNFDSPPKKSPSSLA